MATPLSAAHRSWRLKVFGATWLSYLADELYHGRYRPSLPRWIDIPKPNKPGQFRRPPEGPG